MCPNSRRANSTFFPRHFFSSHSDSAIAAMMRDALNGVTVITHPLVQHNLTRLRDQRTGPQEFRRVLSEVAALMLYEATRSFPVEPISVRTPLAAARGFQLKREVVLVPVLRA